MNVLVFVQTALREWAYAHTYANSAKRKAALQPWMHRHNYHRPHSALGYQSPITNHPDSAEQRIESQHLGHSP